MGGQGTRAAVITREVEVQAAEADDRDSEGRTRARGGLEGGEERMATDEMWLHGCLQQASIILSLTLPHSSQLCAHIPLELDPTPVRSWGPASQWRGVRPILILGSV